MPGPDVQPPVTRTKITTQWGSSVSSDLAELWTAVSALQASGGITSEEALDTVAAALVAGNNIDITVDDAANTITFHVEALTKADVGLDNVDNTSDATKPLFTTTVRGVVPPPTVATGRFLKDDGTWSTVATSVPNEVIISTTDPIGTYPEAELWLDTDAPAGADPYVGLESAKPASPASPMRYFATDTKRDWLYDGSGWIIMYEPLMTYTPATTFITLGSGGTSQGTYQRSNGWCDVGIFVSLGTGGALTGQPTLGLPNAAAAIMRYQLACMLYWAGTNELRGVNASSAAGAGSVAPLATWGNTAAGQEAAINLSATYPFTWASGCSIQIAGRYRLSSRYS